ncbi:MAG: 1,4-dihydroxy-2-naphthoate octaprenyltransferase [Deltaproteobacteria bacterium]|nr:1,4-dihydroxy-2-naphthoate octaprenyltransferase [Deltaproteobacteria bacterium]
MLSAQKLKLYWLAGRPFSFTVSVFPPIIGGLLAYGPLGLNWLNFLLCILGCLLCHAGVNVLSDYYDYKNNVDREETFGSSRLLVEGKISIKEALILAAFLFCISSSIGVYFMLTIPNGHDLIWLILLGAFLGFFYTAGPITLKYHGLGDFGVFVAFGPAMSGGASFVQSGSYSWPAFLYIIPCAFLVDAILHSNNLRDIEHDKKVNIKTVAAIIGQQAAKKMYFTLVIAAYLSIVILVLFSNLSAWALLTCITIPAAQKLWTKIKAMGTAPLAEFAQVDALTAQLHAKFSVLLMLALIISTFSLDQKLWKITANIFS